MKDLINLIIGFVILIIVALLLLFQSNIEITNTQILIFVLLIYAKQYVKD